MLGGAHGNARGEWRHGLVADVLVDDVGSLPELRDVDVAIEPEPCECLGKRLARHTVQGERNRVDGARNQVGARTRRLERGRERVATGSLAVDAHRQTGLLAEPRDQFVCSVRLERPGRVVQEHPHGAEIRQLARLCHQRVGLAGPARAVDEPCLELAACPRDRVRRFTKIRDVVERIVQPEDVDAVFGSRSDEPADEVVVDRARPDEQAAAKRQAEWSLDVRLQRADSLPGALDSSPDRTVEAATARNFQIGEAGLIENLADLQLLRGGQPAR